MNTLTSSVFSLEPLAFSNGTEQILRGGRKLFPLLPQAFEGIKTIAFIGWGSQGPAQAQNLRDSLKSAGSDIVVKVGLQNGSKSFVSAREAGFNEADGTLGLIEQVVCDADMVILLIADGAQTKSWKWITGLMNPGATLGLSHGFLLGHLKSVGESFRPDINVILMAPKGMGRSVRLLYLQGQETEGAGINSSVAVEQDVNGHALDYALGWAVGTGSPVTFFTTMESEVRSDLFGERSMLLGGLWGLSEALYSIFLRAEPTLDPKKVFLFSAVGITSTVSKLISERGLIGLYQSMEIGNRLCFEEGYMRAYGPARRVMLDIYSNIASWQEVKEVVEATEALAHAPMSNIEASDMWAIGKELYGTVVPMEDSLAFAAGMYVGAIMAQMDILRENGHCTSEIVNESLIEAIDSLNPFMDARGVSYMVDNCSTTARLGTRKWGPRFCSAFLDNTGNGDDDLQIFEAFLKSPLHADIAACFRLRPSVRIAVS
jgi:ketol-acid reductoisomerase